MILVISSVPVPAFDAPAGTDKGVHGALYLVLGYLSGQSLLAGRTARLLHLGLLVTALSAFGAVDELHQLWIGGRSADVRDWIADTIGGVLGVAIVLLRTAFAARALS